jgi:type I restriction enzyme, S subunit
VRAVFVEMFKRPTTNGQWPEIQLQEIADIITGYPFSSAEYVLNHNSVNLCRGANVLPSRIDWSDLVQWPQSKSIGLENFALQESDVVIAMDRPWISEGFKIAQIGSDDLPALLVQRVARLRGNTGIPNSFLFHLLKQSEFTRHCRPTETTVPHISPRDIKTFSFPLPSKEDLQKFDIVAKRLGCLKKEQAQALTHLNTLFTSLQQRAFRGEL